MSEFTEGIFNAIKTVVDEIRENNEGEVGLQLNFDGTKSIIWGGVGSQSNVNRSSKSAI